MIMIDSPGNRLLAKGKSMLPVRYKSLCVSVLFENSLEGSALLNIDDRISLRVSGKILY